MPTMILFYQLLFKVDPFSNYLCVGGGGEI